MPAQSGLVRRPVDLQNGVRQAPLQHCSTCPLASETDVCSKSAVDSAVCHSCLCYLLYVQHDHSGYGYESTASYARSQLSFWDIGNIHVMRTSLGKLEALALSTSTPDARWSALVEDTVRLIFNCVVYTCLTCNEYAT